MTETVQQITETVREKYADRAKIVLNANTKCCGGGGVSADLDPVTSLLYSTSEEAELPEAAVLASLGCGNPVALASLHPGETVLDLGSGGGIDVLLSAKRVGPTGHAYGVDMTDEMLELAERNKKEAGAENVTFLKGRIEAIPLADNTVDVIISNCVINLAADKAPVIKEAFRVLKPGGRFAVSDVVSQGALPDDLRSDMEAWIGCVAGALEEQEYIGLLRDAGFEQVSIEATRVYNPRELAESMSSGNCCGGDGEKTDKPWDETAYGRFEASGGQLISGFVRAVKPIAG